MSASSEPNPIVAAMLKAQAIQLNLANLSESDKRFITGLVELFTDPARAEELQHLRKGNVLLVYASDGACHVRALFSHN
jgi:hypothetical protein